MTGIKKAMDFNKKVNVINEKYRSILKTLCIVEGDHSGPTPPLSFHKFFFKVRFKPKNGSKLSEMKRNC